MRKLFILLAAFFVLVATTGKIFADAGAYKNNLLKIELTKIDDSHYDIGLYTQKIYNEPVKIIKKSDTIYYFLLPETSHSITSVPPLDAIKNVIIKSYPYAGQDMENSYTKVAIITSKPLELTTSLRTLDVSVSPRLDPLRLAKLDQVFERYSERLAQNNVPTPLAEFRKTASSQRPVLQSSVDVSSKTSTAESAGTAQISKTPSETSAAKTASTTVSSASSKTTQTASSTKTGTAGKTSTAAVKSSAGTSGKTTAAVTAATAATASAIAVNKASVTPKAVSNSKETVKQTAVPLKTASNAPQTVKQAASVVQTPKSAVNGIAAPSPTKQVQPAENKPVNGIQAEQNTGTVKSPVLELEEQLPNAKPTEVEFSRNVEVNGENKDNKEVKAEVPESMKKAAPAAISPNVVVNKKANGSKQNMPLTLGILGVLFALYVGVRVQKSKNNAKLAQSAGAAIDNTNMKEFLKSRIQASKEAPQAQEPEPVYAEDVPVSSTELENSFENAPVENPINQNDILVANDAVFDEEDKVKAFNAYMDTISDTTGFDDVVNLNNAVEDDAVIKELYTPITTYTTEGNALSSADITPVTQEIESPIPQTNFELPEEDVATIVSSSKLTETRGLYLAKFEGATSLVGYIQDDIYVLYNFGDMEVKETEIQSSLAQENETDSLYIVKTGGKKLMVKSTPYDLSLEMVM